MIRNITRAIRAYRKNRRGMAAVEFALCAPVLFGGLVVMVDLGLAITEQMTLDQAVRSGAEFVMSGVTDTEDLEELIAAAATGLSSQDADDVDLAGYPLVVALQSCRCGAEGAVVSCTTVCANDLPAYSYFYLSAEKTYQAHFIADLVLRSEMTVQTR